MSKSNIANTVIAFCLCGLLQAGAIAQEADPSGSQLYLAKGCVGCHGTDGRSPSSPAFPKVAGQTRGYLYNQMRDIKNGSRNNGQSIIMMGIMAAVSDKEMQLLADWMSAQ